MDRFRGTTSHYTALSPWLDRSDSGLDDLRPIDGKLFGPNNRENSNFNRAPRCCSVQRGTGDFLGCSDSGILAFDHIDAVPVPPATCPQSVRAGTLVVGRPRKRTLRSNGPWAFPLRCSSSRHLGSALRPADHKGGSCAPTRTWLFRP